MRVAKKYAVPSELALLYDFLNSVDLRGYFEKGRQHIPSDELGTQAQFEIWMRERGLLKKGESPTVAGFRRALELRAALRSYVELPPDSRATARKLAEDINRIGEFFPLVVEIDPHGAPNLRPAQGASGLARVLAELRSLGDSRRLDRLKMCSAEECRWVFFDRSKPGNRRWCSSLLCGNRHKTRDYRERVRAHSRHEQS